MDASLERKIDEVVRYFGGALDRGSVEAILAVCENDARAAIRFLSADAEGGGVEDRGYDIHQLQNNDELSIPSDYPGFDRRRNNFVNNRRNDDDDDDDDDGFYDDADDVAAAAAGRERADAEVVNVDTLDMRKLFLKDASLKTHYEAQKGRYAEYVATLLLLLSQGVEIVRGSRAKILASAWARNDYKLGAHLLRNHGSLFQLPHVLTALEYLDAPRQCAQLERKLAQIQKVLDDKKGGKGKKKKGSVALAAKMGPIRGRINDLRREAHIGSVTSSVASHVRQWVREIPSEQLAFFALLLSPEPWRRLANLLHLNPKTDFQPLNIKSSSNNVNVNNDDNVNEDDCKLSEVSFLEYAFGKEAPEGSMLAECRKINSENVERIIDTFPVPYSFIRVQVKPLPDAVKPKIARYMTLDHLIWYHEELASPAVDTVLAARLADGEVPDLPYGKLMERLLYFRGLGSPIAEQLIPIAERRLGAIQLSLEPPVACFGDASYSMDVAIRCSTIIGSVLTCLTGADLEFFTDAVVPPPVIPRSIRDVLRVVDTVAATGLTAPAASLWPLYRERRAVKFMIMVTDEVENVKSDGVYWPTLYKRYLDEVAPDCTAVFVSFLPKDTMKGRMVAALEALGVRKIIQFRLDSTRPDLTKLDTLLGILASESSYFPEQIRILTQAFEDAMAKGGEEKEGAMDSSSGSSGIEAIVERLKTPLIEKAVEVKMNVEDEDEEVVVEEEKGGDDSSNGGNKEVKKKKKGDDMDGMCIVCYERKIGIAFMNCAHTCVCEECSKVLKECPLCRNKIVSKIKVFLP